MSLNDDNLSFDTIETWKVDSLKVFLKKRGLSTVGTKKELVARVFVASEQKLPLVATQEEPSQHLNSEPHKVWNSLLFKIDAAWKSGLTNPACTSVESNWDKPKTKFAMIQPIRVKDIKIKKPHFRKQGEPDVHINPSERQLFSPTASKARKSDALNYFTSVLLQAVVSIQFQDPAPEEQNTCQIPERDPFDPEFWEGVKPKLVHFFTKHVAAILLSNAAICNEKTLPCLQKSSDVSKDPIVHNLNEKATGVSQTIRKREKRIKTTHNNVICRLCDSVC
ncbi:hypothetical protein ACJMK2_025325 [Sinanodonta woodiana]|uniref:SAP domain-containing protein n=1 Tax=Sinanodonta woodiana TaxID=1069815 RepID=A0ABD3XGM9_SINWO